MSDFKGKVILITGGGTGLGAAIAIGAAERGAKALLLNYSRSRQEAEATAKAVEAAGAEARLVQGDVGEDADCRKIAAAAEPYGKLDVLVNNAGITKHVPKHSDLDGLTKEDFLRIYAINTVAPFQMIRACRSLLEAAGSASVLMTSSIARALAPKIRVNAICPGFMDTRWFSDAYDKDTAQRIRDNVRSSTPLQVVSTAEDVADAALFLISDAARRITGETLLVDAGQHLGTLPPRAR